MAPISRDDRPGVVRTTSPVHSSSARRHCARLDSRMSNRRRSRSLSASAIEAVVLDVGANVRSIASRKPRASASSSTTSSRRPASGMDSRVSASRSGDWPRGDGGKLHRRSSNPCSGPATLGRDLSSVGGDQVPHDGQAKTEASAACGRGPRVSLSEAVEDLRQETAKHPFAGVVLRSAPSDREWR